jgi:methylmalonyl-CoA mutase
MESSGPPSGTDDAPSEPLAAEFPAVDAARWEAVVRAKERDPDRPLATALEEGIEVNWLYTPRDALAPDPGGAAGAEPFVRGWRVGSPWAIRQQNATTQRRQANLEILEELEGGATELLLVTAAPDRGGIPVSTVDELQEVLDGVYLDLAPVALDAGTQAAETAALLTEVWRRSTHPAVEMRGSLRLDPIGALAGSGQATRPQLADEIDAAARILSEVHAEFPQVQVLAVDTTPYVEAGAGAVLELALALSTAIAYLRAGDDIDVDPAAVAAAIEFTLVAGPDQFLEIAKLRAARRLWSHVLAQCGVAAVRRCTFGPAGGWCRRWTRGTTCCGRPPRRSRLRSPAPTGSPCCPSTSPCWPRTRRRVPWGDGWPGTRSWSCWRRPRCTRLPIRRADPGTSSR